MKSLNRIGKPHFVSDLTNELIYEGDFYQQQGSSTYLQLMQIRSRKVTLREYINPDAEIKLFTWDMDYLDTHVSLINPPEWVLKNAVA